jgi:hypothetical protein
MESGVCGWLAGELKPPTEVPRWWRARKVSGSKSREVGRVGKFIESCVMHPLDVTTARPRSKALDRALSLIAALLVVAIVVVARY